MRQNESSIKRVSEERGACVCERESEKMVCVEKEFGFVKWSRFD